MNRWLLASILPIALVGGVGAQDPAPPAPAPQVFPEQVVKHSKDFRMSSRVLFVVDVSGSMSGEPLRQAVDSVLMIAGSDGFRVGAIAFTGSHTPWTGVPRCHPGHHQQAPRRGVQASPRASSFAQLTPCGRRCVPSGWADVPRDLQAFMDWLRGLNASGGTDPSGALEAAIKNRRAQTVVFVSDGDFTKEPALEAIKKAQAWRKANKLPPMPIMVWGAGAAAKTNDQLRAIAKDGGGGMWVHGSRRSGPW
jgi:Mg-chelatase subunit ChlD